jgi:hypothetical protein
MRYRLRTLLIMLAVGPMVGAWGYREFERAVKARKHHERQLVLCVKPPPYASIVKSASLEQEPSQMTVAELLARNPPALIGPIGNEEKSR